MGWNKYHDMRVVNTDTKSYANKTSEICLHKAAKAKKKKYLGACLQKRRHFSPFIISFNGLLVVEAKDTLKRISIRLVTEWQKPYMRTCI